ncbi:MAG TPA: DUF924 family protein [Casimicrobiaceae bacterium]|jgi:uncharacterized protein (DUF924 family)|nr:DUF924 family protein [Casimicrobiaceae bacterium]
MTQAMQDQILDFWFGPPDSEDYGTTRDMWFRKSAAIDAEIRGRFGAVIETALGGALADWTAPRAALARVLVLDQFTRNCYRGSARAFAGDAQALAAATAAVDQGRDRELIPVERWFLYMPFEHSESPAAQERSLALFTRLAQETGLSDPLAWSEKHAAVIRRFGRYPHRNALLGRESTPQEIAFLATQGSNF